MNVNTAVRYVSRLVTHPVMSYRLARIALLGLVFAVIFVAVDSHGTQFHVEQARHRIMASPGALVEMTSEDVERVLGYPRMFRSEPPAQYWQYRAEACVLDLVFYESEKARRDPQVEHYQLRGRESGAFEDDLEGADQENCLEELLSRR